MTDADVVQVQLYAKPGCHLCEQAEADLARLQRRYPHSVQVLDITQDAKLMHEYGVRIPVLVVDGREYSAPLEVTEIERALAAATHSPARAARQA